MRIVWSLAWAQLRHHRARWALVCAGMALVVVVPVVTAGLATSVSAQTVRRTVSQLDLTDRTLLVSQEADSSLRKGTPQQNDHAARTQLARLTSSGILREALFRELTVAGSSFVLGGVDELGTAVRLLSGRLPRSCTPTRCEVVVVGGRDSTALRRAVASLGAVVVGRVERANPLLVSGALDPDGIPLVLSADVDAITRLRSLELFGRHYAWVSSVDADRVVALGTAGYLARSADVDAALASALGAVSFARPDDRLQQAQYRADVSTKRFGLLGGFAAVLLLGFAVVAAVGLRRESRLLATLLTRRGASTGQVLGVTVLQAALASAVGALCGATLGAAIAAGLSHGSGAAAVPAAAHALAAADLSVGLLSLAAAAVTVAVLVWPDAEARSVRRMLDVIAVACLGAVLLAGDRGSASMAALASSGDPLVVALPVLASIVAGLAAARAWPPVVRLLEHLLPRSSVAGRMGLLGALRRPLRPVATVAFLTAAVAAVVFAGAYRATLLANDADQAAYQVPLDATIAASSSDLVPTVPADAFGADGHVFPVVRSSAAVTRLAGVTDSVPVIAVDGAALSLADDWRRSTGSSSSAATLAAELHGVTRTTSTLPTSSGATMLEIPARGIDSQTVLTAWLRDADGRAITIILSPRGAILRGVVPRSAARPLRLVAFGVQESQDYATHHAHAVGEGSTDQPLLSGRIVLGAPAVDGVAARWSWSSWGSLRGTARATRAELSLGYRLSGDPVIAAADFAALSAATVPVAVDAQTAEDIHNGALNLRLSSTTVIRARVVATLPRLPTAGSRFVLVDRASLTAVTDLREPGANATEFWVSASATTLDRTLAGAPFARLTVTRRDALRAELDSDPIGRGARNLLIVVALLALGVAAIALVLLVIGERRDGAGELYAWEADGIRPRTLRRMLLVRMASVAAIAVPAGAAGGLAMARVGTKLVAVDASGSTPQPPLQVTLGSAWTALALLTGVGAGVLLGWAVAARTLREHHPIPAEADLR